MIIKYYTQDGSLVIIENVEDVCVPSSPLVDSSEDQDYAYFDFDPDALTEPRKHITYAKEGPCVLCVRGTAYICNNDGKTIEKV